MLSKKSDWPANQFVKIGTDIDNIFIISVSVFDKTHLR